MVQKLWVQDLLLECKRKIKSEHKCLNKNENNIRFNNNTPRQERNYTWNKIDFDLILNTYNIFNVFNIGV